MKKIIYLFFVITLVLFSCKNSKKKSIIPNSSTSVVSAIENDCEQLKQYLSNCAIDISYAIDDGLNIDEVIDNIKQTYVKNVDHLVKNENLMPNEKGIYEKAFVYAVASNLQKIPMTNLCTNLLSEGIKYNIFYPKFVIPSDIYFEKQNSDYIVFQSNIEQVRPGMKYKGDKINLVRTIINGKELYRFVAFSEYETNTINLILDSLSLDVPVHFDLWGFTDCVNINYSLNNDILFARIDTFEPSAEDINLYNKNLQELCSNIYKSNNIILDLRENLGGKYNNFLPIVYTLLFGENFQDYEIDCKNISDYCEYGVNYLNSEIVKTKLQEANDTTLQTSNSSRYYTNNSKEDIFNYIPKYDGNIYIITNVNTAMSTEIFISMLLKYFGQNVILVGQNSSNYYKFPDTQKYILNDSKITLTLSYTDYCNSYFFKGIADKYDSVLGFIPDYWIFSDYNIDAKDIISYIQL